LNDNFELIEDHDHTSGKGAPIVAASLDIDDDLPFNAHQATELDAAQFVDSSLDPSTPATANNLSLFAKNGNLYFQDGLGSAAAVQITAAGAVAGTPGTIGSLAAPASVTWASLAGNLIFEADSGDGTMMRLASGGISLYPPGSGGGSGDPVSIQAPAVPTAPGYTITLPVAPPAATQVVGMTSAGVLVLNPIAPGMVPLGGVIATFPNITGAYSCANKANAGADAAGYVQCAGTVGERTVGAGQGITAGQEVPNINNDVFLAGHTTAGTVGGANTKTISVSGSVTMPAHTHNLDVNGGAYIGIKAGTSGFDIGDLTGVGQLDTDGNPTAYAGPTFTHDQAYYADDGFGGFLTIPGVTKPSAGLLGRTAAITSAPSVGFTSTGSNDVRPSYITAVYIMRVK
jgi:hypothetical protein